MLHHLTYIPNKRLTPGITWTKSRMAFWDQCDCLCWAILLSELVFDFIQHVTIDSVL